jgi:hypothetical protein
MAKILGALCLCPDTLWKNKLKGDILIPLVAEISREHNT